MAAPEAEINVEAEQTIRVYVDITRDVERKVRLRCMLMENASGRKITRKEYLEKLIADDIAKVQGASLREVSSRQRQRKQ
jgi:hypothetical protein